jgi:hypothetical protein
MSKKPTDLLGQTYALLDKELATGEARGESQAKVLAVVAAGSGVGVEWCKKLVRRRIPNPGVLSIQAVHDFLAGPRDLPIPPLQDPVKTRP